MVPVALSCTQLGVFFSFRETLMWRERSTQSDAVAILRCRNEQNNSAVSQRGQVDKCPRVRFVRRASALPFAVGSSVASFVDTPYSSLIGCYDGQVHYDQGIFGTYICELMYLLFDSNDKLSTSFYETGTGDFRAHGFLPCLLET